MSKVVFIGNTFNLMLPVGTILVALIVIFRLWQKCMAGLGCKQIHIDPEDMSPRELMNGFEIIRSARHELSEVLDNDVIRGVLNGARLVSTDNLLTVSLVAHSGQYY
jgi:hypothetical protein